MRPQIAPYGSWKSPITSERIVRGSVGLSQPLLDGDDLYWIEARPLEKGRGVVIRRTADGQTREITPAELSARTRVHEYGGGDYTVFQGIVYTANNADQQVYRIPPDGLPAQLTHSPGRRYADLVSDARHRRLVAVCEDHTGGPHEPANMLISIDVHTGREQILAQGHDFYASPAVGTDRLAWLSWNHPNMPWDGCELWIADVADDGTLMNPRHIAGSTDESIFQPQWSPDGILYFITDRTGWSNLARWHDGQMEMVWEQEAEFATPQWVFGLSTYAFLSADSVVCSYRQHGLAYLAILQIGARRWKTIPLPFNDIRYVRANERHVTFLGGGEYLPNCVVRFDVTDQTHQVMRSSSEVPCDRSYLSGPEAIEFPTAQGETAYGFFYPPKNVDYSAPTGELPPLLVKSHGGPTSAANPSLSLWIQYWTTRGIAVLDVNYGGSTGYGRRYRQRLNGKWGIVDVDDCVHGAQFLVQQGRVDGRRLMITGGSAGGYTTLCALAFRDTFRAGASHYGVSDATALAQDTHKFEARYLDRLIGPFPAAADVYYQRSPIHFADQIDVPVILFQGLEDKVVPPSQSELLFETLKKNGIPTAYVPFEGEQHGFRQAENIRRALDGELYFYSRVFGFPLAEPIEPIEIVGLKTAQP